MPALRAKSLQLADAFLALVAQECGRYGFVPLAPPDAAKRGSQISFRHPAGYAIMQAMIERGVIGDFRAPDVLRFGLAPMYVRYIDVWDAVAALNQVMRSEAWRAPAFQMRRSVT